MSCWRYAFNEVVNDWALNLNTWFKKFHSCWRRKYSGHNIWNYNIGPYFVLALYVFYFFILFLFSWKWFHEKFREIDFTEKALYVFTFLYFSYCPIGTAFTFLHCVLEKNIMKNNIHEKSTCIFKVVLIWELAQIFYSISSPSVHNIWILKFFFFMFVAIKMSLDNIYTLLNTYS